MDAQARSEQIGNLVASLIAEAEQDGASNAVVAETMDLVLALLVGVLAGLGINEDQARSIFTHQILEPNQDALRRQPALVRFMAEGLLSTSGPQEG